MTDPVEAMVERLRCEVERWRPQLEAGTLTSISVNARLMDADGNWKAASMAGCDGQVIRKHNAKAFRERRLTGSYISV